MRFKAISSMGRTNKSRNDDRIESLDAVRGYAIIAVLAIHCSQVVAPTSKFMIRLTSLGSRGVQLFYIASAFVMFLWLNRRPIKNAIDAKAYIVARVARLAPMFWLALALYVYLWGFTPRFWAPDGVGYFQVALTALMLHTWWPDAANSIVPGGWSVGVEVTFYMVAPLLVLAIRNIWTAAIALIATTLATSAICYEFSRLFQGTAASKSYLLDQFANVISFPPQMPAFASGVLLYFIWRSGFRLKWPVALALFVGSVILCWQISNTMQPTFLGVTLSNLTLFSVAMMPSVAALVLCPTLPLNNALARYIGRVSFSIYLLHFALITQVIIFFRDHTHLQVLSRGDINFVIYTATTTLVCIAASTVTYFLLEEPSRRFLVRVLSPKATRGRNEITIAVPATD